MPLVTYSSTDQIGLRFFFVDHLLTTSAKKILSILISWFQEKIF